MTGFRSSRRALALGSAGLLLTAVLSACSSGTAPGASPSDPGTGDASDAASAALPLSTTTPATVASAPPVTALPVGQAVPVRHLANRRDGYAYLDRAYYQEDAVENAPPDYSFDDNGVRPWAWSTRDGSRVISEPVAGGYRYYYYQAGADSPYLVRDPRYSYAYDNGALVGVFTASGEQIDAANGSEYVVYAGRYMERGHNLYRGSSMQQHEPVNAYAWNDRRADIAAQRAAWHQQISANPDWSAWNGEHHEAEERVWNDDREQHQAAAQQFGNWQQQHFQGQPPQLYTQPSNGNHTAAIVGGVVAAGLAAVAIHDLTHHDHGNQGQNQGQNPRSNPGNNAVHPQPQGIVPQNNGAHPGETAPGNRPAGQAPGAHYGPGEHQGQGEHQAQGERQGQGEHPGHGEHQAMQPDHTAPPQYAHSAPQPSHPATGNYAQPMHQAGLPAHERGAQPARPEHMMAPHNTQPAPHYAAPQAVHAEPAHVAPATRPEPHVAPAPHPEPHAAPVPHPEQPHPGPQDRQHEHHEHP